MRRAEPTFPGRVAMRRAGFDLAVAVAVVFLLAAPVAAVLDRPHNDSFTTPPDPCAECHMTHQAQGGSITAVDGNANLCINCHTSGQRGQDRPFVAGDQAIPGTSGNSHRWDSGASGWVALGTPNSSTGTFRSGGVFTGRYAKTYTITISTAGTAATARFNWTATTPGGGSGSNVLCGTNVALDQGITVTCLTGSFILGDKWLVRVRSDIRQPTSPAMAGRLSNGKMMCSTCHNQHLQAAAPFDGAAPVCPSPPPPPTPQPAAGWGRHFMRMDNDLNQMCLDCHNVRNVNSSTGGSHPVGIAIPGSGSYKTPNPTPIPGP